MWSIHMKKARGQLRAFDCSHVYDSIGEEHVPRVSYIWEVSHRNPWGSPWRYDVPCEPVSVVRTRCMCIWRTAHSTSSYMCILRTTYGTRSYDTLQRIEEDIHSGYSTSRTRVDNTCPTLYLPIGTQILLGLCHSSPKLNIQDSAYAKKTAWVKIGA